MQPDVSPDGRTVLFDLLGDIYSLDLRGGAAKPVLTGLPFESHPVFSPDGRSFAFISAWNNFLFALMFMSQQDRFTVPVGLSYLLGEFGADFGALAAGGLVAILPVVILFAYVQKFLVQGMSAGAVKG